MTFVLFQQPAPAKATPRIAPQAPTTPGTPVPATADLGALQSQLGELTIQHSGLKAQWEGLRRQLDNMLQSNPARPGIQQEWADVGSQVAQIEGQIAVVKARIEAKQGFPSAVVPPRTIRRGPDPDLIAGGSIALAMALILPLSI
jgi:hypothetical protein